MAKKNQPTANSTTATLTAKPTGGVVESKPAAQPAASAPVAKAGKTVTHEEIAKAAYNRWVKFGGDEKTNWLAAERELRGS